MARWAGAEVFATASPGIKTEQALAGGAHQVFDRADPDCAQRILDATQGQGIDRIVEVDLGGNLQNSLKVLAVNGAISSYASRGNDRPVLPVYEMARKCLRIHSFYLPSLPLALRQRAQAGMAEWLAGGPRIHRVVGPFPLEQAVAAHEAVERGGKLGTVVVAPQLTGA
jgi:NADPH2:quinone reductase